MTGTTSSLGPPESSGSKSFDDVRHRARGAWDCTKQAIYETQDYMRMTLVAKQGCTGERRKVDIIIGSFSAWLGVLAWVR